MRSKTARLRCIHDLKPIASNDGVQSWEITGNDPQFLIEGLDTSRPGFYQLELRLPKDRKEPLPQDAVLYFDTGAGFTADHVIPLTFREHSGRATADFALHDGAHKLRFDPTTQPGIFSITGARLTRLSTTLHRTRRLAAATRQRVRRPRDLVRLSTKSIRILSDGGLPALRASVGQALVAPGDRNHDNTYATWVRLYDTPRADEATALRRKVEALAHKPLISVVMPTYNTPAELLTETIESVRNQIYPNWELCIADDASPEPHVRGIIESYAKRDKRIKVVIREKNGHISHATNSAMELASGEWIALLDHDDILREHALAEVALEIGRHPDAELIYSDEDKIDSVGERYDAYFKPDFSRELFRSQNYLNHLTVHRAANIRKVGGWRPGFEGSQDYDLNLRIIEQIDEKAIRHIPKILYHWRAVAGSTASAGSEKSYAYTAGLRALKEHVERLKLDATAEEVPGLPFYRLRHHVPEPQPLVSLIIPTRDGLDFLKNCIASIREKTTYRNYEIIVVDNGSTEKATHAYFREIAKHDNVRVLAYDKPFNYSAINNFAVRHAEGFVIGLINNDIEVIAPDWLTEMVSYAIQPDIGCVGAKLLYGNDLVQHAGIVLGIGGVAGHSHKYFPADHYGDHARLMLPQNMSASTAACLVVRRDVFLEVGGLNEKDLVVAFNDVDFCLRVREAGYKNVWTPFAELYHLESVTRGAEDNPAKVKRFNREADYMKSTWGARLTSDPYYSPNLTLEHEDFSLAFPPRVSD